MATLIVLQGPDKGKTFKTADEEVLLGRGSDQVPLTDRTISRRHAELRPVDGAWTISDLNSANGTYVNGVRIATRFHLKHGDQIRMGSTLLVYAGDERVERLSGSGIPRDLVTLDVASAHVDASIVSSVPSNEDSVVMAAPETADAVKAWKVMRELTAVIGHFLPPEQLLARVVDIIFEEVEVDRCVVLMRDPETDELIPEVVRYRRSAAAGQNEIIASRTIVNHAIETREGVLCSNVQSDERFESGKSVKNLGMRSVICVPILARERVLGVIHLDCQVTQHTYTEPELRLLTAIGYQSGLAIENAQLVQAQLRRERLAAAGETVAYLAHYVKNILQGIQSGSDVVKRGLARRDFAVTAQGWEIVSRNLEKATRLMLNMLAFSKDREPRLEMLQLNRIVQDVVALVQKQADDKRAVLLADLDDDLPPIPLDYDGIHQVILNLVINAIEAVESDTGVVNVRTAYDPASRHAVLTVTDNGPGVPEADRERVFEAFHSTKGHGGTGLGLAVARKIVHELNGTIEIARPPDGGAQLIVRLPSYDTRLISAEDTQSPSARRPG